MSINHLNIQNKQTGDKLSATEFNSTTSKINEVVDGVNASATGGKIGSNGTPLTKDSSGRIIIPLATSSSSGAMSASDKSKLDSINPSGGTGDYVDSISNEANYTANDMYDTTSEFYGTNHKINTRSISYTTSDGSTHTFTHLDTVYKPATASTTINGQVISGKAGLLSPQDKQKLDMMPRPSDITSALSGKADKQIVVLVTRTQQGSTYVYSASKTFTEISTAIGNGTNVILQYDGNYYHLSYSTRDYIVFTRFADDYYMFSSIEVNSHDEWSYSSFILQEELTIDSTPTSGSNNPISSGGVYNALRSNFKTVNGVQLLGSGNIQTQFFINFEQVNGEWSCDWEFSDMKNTYIAGATLRGLIELGGNSYFSDVSEARNNFMRFTWIIPSESGSSPYSIYNQNLLVLEAQEISTGEDMFATVIYQRFNKPIITPTDLRAVAFSGSYSDLSDTPTFKTINGNSIVGSGSVTIDTSMIPYVSQDSHADFQGCVLDEVLNYLDDYKQATLTFDTTPTQNSTNPVTSGGVFSALRYDGNSTNYVASDDSFEDCIESLDSELANKQDTLVSGTNIKTVNGTTLLGSGDIDADDVIMGKIDGTSFYKVTGYSGLNAIPTFSTTAETGDENKIYVDILTNKAYRWNKRIVSVGESKYKLLSEELSIVTDNEINSLLPPSTKKAVSAKVLRDNFYTESEVDTLLGAKQDTLVSGTNIKTINGESLLGSSNITLDTETVNYDGDGNTYFAAGDSLTEGLDSMADAIDNINPNEISSITATESTASGGNNVVTITQTNGTTTSFNVKNGIDGVDGQDGADGVSLGEVALVQTTGDSEESVMSQKAVTEKFDTVVYESKRPSYFKGTFSKFNIADFPLFDPRDSDGISVLIEWDKKSGNRVSLFEMMTANQNNNQQFFALAYQWGNIKTGLISSYFQNVDMGCSGTTPANYNHLVITLDFKNGITKIYINGVLYNTIQASNYSYETLMTYLNTCTKIGLGGSSSNAETKTQGLAVFGHVLTDDDVTTLFGGGCEELKTELIPEKWEANNLKPHYFNCGIGTYNGGANAGKAGGTIVGDTITIKSDCVVLYLALTGIDGSELYGNCIYDFDFEVLSGTGTTYNRGMQYAGNYWKCFTMTDEDGNDVSYNTQVGVGRYHVTSRPDNILTGGYNGSLNLGYIFVNCSSDFSIKLHSPVRLIERGAAIICTPKTYKGLYWQQRNGYKIPTSGYVYDSSTNTIPYYDIYKSSTVKYASNVPPRFNGQMAVDTTNGRVYVGYLTSTGGTWKQINNS